MDEREKYVTTLIRWLVKHGVITFINTAASALAIGPSGFALGGALSAAMAYFDRGTIQEQVKSMPKMSTNEIVKLAFNFAAVQFAMENILIIINICKDIIIILKRLYENKEECMEKIKSMIRYTPHV